MKRYIFALMGTGLFGQAAFADIPLPVPVPNVDVFAYGSIRTGMEDTRVTGSSVDAKNTTSLRLVDQGSRFGLKGSRKINDDYSLIWQFESRIRIGAPNPDSSSTGDGWSGRDRFIGLKAPYGTFTAGERYDIIDDSAGDFFWAMGNLFDSDSASTAYARRGSARERGLFYYSPDMNGFRVKTEFAVANANNNAYNKTSTQNPYKYAATGWYKNKLFAAGFGYKYWNDQVALIPGSYANASSTSISSGGSAAKDGARTQVYEVGGTLTPLPGWAFSVAAQEAVLNDTDATYRQPSYGAGILYTTGKWAFNGSYGALGSIKANSVRQAQTKAAGIMLETSYAVTDGTLLVVSFNYARNDANSSLFNSRLGDVGAPGGTAKSVVAGIRTDF